MAQAIKVSRPRLNDLVLGRGSHHIFRKEGVAERINLQRDDGHAKPYQVRQVRRVILNYKLEEDDRKLLRPVSDDSPPSDRATREDQQCLN